MKFYADKYGTATNALPAQTSTGSEAVVVITTASLPNATVLTDGDLIYLGTIPQGYKCVGLTLFAEDLDEGAALAFSVGLCDAADAVLDTVFVATSNLGQAGGTLAVPATTTMFTTAAASTDKILAIEVTTTAAVAMAAARKVGAVVTYIPVSL